MIPVPTTLRGLSFFPSTFRHSDNDQDCGGGGDRCSIATLLKNASIEQILVHILMDCTDDGSRGACRQEEEEGSGVPVQRGTVSSGGGVFGIGCGEMDVGYAILCVGGYVAPRGVVLPPRLVAVFGFAGPVRVGGTGNSAEKHPGTG